jgi:aconitate hydratase
MINGLGVLGWGVGGIEAEAAMLAQPVTMLIPDVVGFELTGELVDGVTATDLVLRIVELLRQKGVVGKFVEFYGSGLKKLTLADRATIANMAPEYGATCGFFPVDEETVSYLNFTGREAGRVELAQEYSKAQGLWLEADQTPVFTESVCLDLGSIEAAIAGPKRPQDRISLSSAPAAFKESLDGLFKSSQKSGEKFAVEGKDHGLRNGDVVIAAITSCTNTSNPAVMLAAGLVAQKANALGLKVQPWVKTSLAPGSQVVTDYLVAAGLQAELDNLGFNLVGYGCTTCIGNSGPLEAPYSKVIHDKDLVVTSVLSGNRNFEGRISPDIKANYLASPPLVVVYALAGTLLTDFDKDPIGQDKDGKDVFLKDVWPSTEEVQATMSAALSPEMFRSRYANVFKGPKKWQEIPTSGGFLYEWDENSTYVKHPPFFQTMTKDVEAVADIKSAKMLAKLGDSVTTDHISPAGAIGPDSAAGKYLTDKKVERRMFNSFGSRRGNHEVMMRGTFGNIRIRNELVPGVEGGYTKHLESGEQMTIYDAAMRYQKEGHDLVVIAGKEYGTGSSRDWAAKGTYLQGVKAVIAESYERIHRSNLIGMGVMPLEFKSGDSRESLSLKGDEEFSMQGLDKALSPGCSVPCEIKRADGTTFNIDLQCRIDTEDELSYFRNGGILNFVIRRLL